MSQTVEPGDYGPPAEPDLAVGAPSGDRHRRGGRASTRARPGVLGAIALGAPARYGVAQVIHASANTFPWASSGQT